MFLIGRKSGVKKAVNDVDWWRKVEKAALKKQ